MKPECSLESNEEPLWTPLSRVNDGGYLGNIAALPSKAVLALVQSIEQGHFPIIFINVDNQEVLPKSTKALEAYIRCHISIVPILYEEPEEKKIDKDPLF